MNLLRQLGLTLGLLLVLLAGGLVVTPHASVALALPAACMPPQSPPPPPGCVRQPNGNGCYDRCPGDTTTTQTGTGTPTGHEGDDLARQMFAWFGWVFDLMISLGALWFLWNHQVQKFIQFASVAVLAAVFMIHPQAVAEIATAIWSRM